MVFFSKAKRPLDKEKERCFATDGKDKRDCCVGKA